MIDIDISAYRDKPQTVYLAGEYDRLTQKIKDAEALVASDPAMAELAVAEIKELTELQTGLGAQMEAIMNKAKAVSADGSPASLVLEVRAGAGGSESALFAAPLGAMYQRYFA